MSIPDAPDSPNEPGLPSPALRLMRALRQRKPGQPAPPPPPKTAPIRFEDKRQVLRLWGPSIVNVASSNQTIKIARPNPKRGSVPSKLVDRVFAKPHQPKADGADYTIDRLIGEGGMGIIYEATQRCLNRSVAVKAIRTESATDEESRRMFLAEALVTGDLDHPNIVPVHELGTNGEGLLFYAMKRVRGTPWHRVILKKTLDENLEILLRVADAVAFAHSRGVLHCDLKPENVMLGDFGEVYVMDWGLAISTVELKEANQSGRKTSLGGTPAYMPPEFVNKEPTKVGPASDVYLLGAILYEILCGQPPHAGDTVSQALVSASQNIISPIFGNFELSEIAMRAMDSDPDKRYANVKEFQAELRLCRTHMDSIRLMETAEGHLEEARKESSYSHFGRALHAYEQALTLWDGNDAAKQGLSETRSEYARCAMGRADLELAESLLEGDDPETRKFRQQIAGKRRERDHRQQIMRRMKMGLVILAIITIATLAITEAWIRAQRNEAERESFIDGTSLATQHLLAGDWDEIRPIRDRLHGAVFGWEWEWLDKNSQPHFLSMDHEAHSILRSRQSLNGDLSAFLDSKGVLEFHRGTNIWQWNAGESIQDFALIENGPDLSVLTWNGREIITHDGVTGKETSRLAIATERAEQGSLSVDGKRLLIIDSNGVAFVRQTDTGALISQLELLPEGRAFQGNISPDGTRVAMILKPPYCVGIWDAQTGKLLVHGPEFRGTGQEQLKRLEYLPDGKNILLGSFDWSVGVMEGEKLTPVLTLPMPAEPSAFAASSDGRLVAAGTAKGDLQILDLVSGERIWRTHLAGISIRSLVFRDFANGLAVSDAEGRTFELRLNDRQSWRTLALQKLPFLRLLFDKDGRTLWAGDQDNVLWMIPLERSGEIKRAPCPFVPAFPHSSLGMIQTNEGEKIIAGWEQGLGVYDLKSNERVIWHRGKLVRTLTATLDGSSIAFASDDRIYFFDAKTGKETNSIVEPGRTTTLKWSPDGKRLAIGTVSGDVFLLQVAKGTFQKLHHSQDAILCLAFSPDGQYLVSSAQDRDVCAWKTKSGRFVDSLAGHEHVVLDMTFSPDRLRLFTSSADGKVHIFDTKSWRQITSFIAHRGAVVQVLMSPDGSTLVTSGTDGEIRLWPGTRTPEAWR